MGGLIQEINRQLTWEDNTRWQFYQTANRVQKKKSSDYCSSLKRRIKSKVLHIPAIDLQKQTAGLIQYLFEVILVLPRSAILISRQPLPARLRSNAQFHVERSGWLAGCFYASSQLQPCVFLCSMKHLDIIAALRRCALHSFGHVIYLEICHVMRILSPE